MAFPCQACREYLHLPGLRGPDPHVWPQGSSISLWIPQELRPKCPPYTNFAFSRPFLLFYSSPSIFPSMPSLPESFSWPLQGGEVCSAHTTHSQSTPFFLSLVYQLLSLILIFCTSIFSFQLHEKHLVKNTRPVFAHSKYMIFVVFYVPEKNLISLYDVV